MSRTAVLVLAVCVAQGLSLFSGALAATITDASLQHHGPATDLYFKLNGQISYQVNSQPQQLSIDLNDTGSLLPVRPFIAQESDPLGAVRLVPLEGGTRVEIDITAPADYVVGRVGQELLVRIAPTGTIANLAAPFLIRDNPRRQRLPPRRLPSSVPAAAASAPRPPAAAIALVEPPVAPQLTLTQPASGGAVRVVIDPGHGGYDPGTVSASGVAEKDLALRIALALRDALASRGISSKMTRDGDYFVSLHDRTVIANRLGADLFVSIHLNSSPNTATTGIETYYLDNSTDRATIRLARMENGMTEDGRTVGSNLNYVLSDMRQEYKASESVLLATQIEADTAAALSAQAGIRTRALGAKKGPFYVLVGAQMPAVLVECGFLSNPDETRVLLDAAYQQTLAAALAGAIVHYFNADVTAGTL